MKYGEYKSTKPIAHRSAIAAADTGDINAIGSLPKFNVADASKILVVLELSATNTSAKFALALWDQLGQLIGVTSSVTLVPQGSWVNGAGNYVAPATPFDVVGASFVSVVIDTLSNGNVVNSYLYKQWSDISYRIDTGSSKQR